MPELPEVESIRAHLQTRLDEDCKEEVCKNSTHIHFRRLTHKRSRIVSFPNCDGVLENLSVKFSKEVGKRQLRVLRRCGKFLLLCFFNRNEQGITTTEQLFEKCVVMLIHLRMSGAFLDSRYTEMPNPAHEHFALHFTEFTLYYVDPRTFSTVQCFFSLTDAIDFLQSKKLGFEGTDLKRSKIFFKKAHDSRKEIKSFLLDQTKIMGLGNIYANEVLFCAGISPKRAIKSLTSAERERLALLIPLLLRFAIAVKGVTVEKKGGYQLPDGSRGGYKAHAMVYGRAGKKCKARRNALAMLLEHFENKAKAAPLARSKNSDLKGKSSNFEYLRSGEIPFLAATEMPALSASEMQLLATYLQQAEKKRKVKSQCDGLVEKITQNGRSTFYCRKCQT